MYILALDQGTSSTKAIVVRDGVVIAETDEPCAPVATPDGGVEIDPNVLWKSVVVAGSRALLMAGGVVPDAIGLANQGETVLAWDRQTGQPAGMAIVWQDRRSAELCQQLAATGWDTRLAELTGLELDPYFAAPKMSWLRARVGPGPVITTTDVWLLHRLCGTFVTDAATASRTLLLNLDSVSWDTDACSAFGIDPDSLPTVVDNAGIVGYSTTFSSSPVPVTGICVDQQAALFAESCHQAGEAKCTFGTGAFLLVSTGNQSRRSVNGLVGCVAWRFDGRSSWCLDGQVYTVGAAITWLQGIGVIQAPSDLDGLGYTVDHAQGAAFVPGLAGLGAPFWAPSAKGAFTGLSLGTTKAHLVRAVIDGIASQVAWLAVAAGRDLGTDLVRLRVDGGLTRSSLLLQTQADLAQMPIEVYPSANATALGVAAMAHQGLTGQQSSLVWSPTATFDPQISADQAQYRLQAWRQIAEATLAL